MRCLSLETWHACLVHHSRRHTRRPPVGVSDVGGMGGPVTRADGGTRNRNLQLGRLALCRLSYIRKARRLGIEPSKARVGVSPVPSTRRSKLPRRDSNPHPRFQRPVSCRWTHRAWSRDKLAIPAGVRNPRPAPADPRRGPGPSYRGVVGSAGFEPATSCTRSKRATWLRQLPRVLLRSPVRH